MRGRLGPGCHRRGLGCVLKSQPMVFAYSLICKLGEKTECDSKIYGPGIH